MLAKKCNVLDVMSVTLGTTNKNNIIYMNYKNIIQFIGAKLKKGHIYEDKKWIQVFIRAWPNLFEGLASLKVYSCEFLFKGLILSRLSNKLR